MLALYALWMAAVYLSAVGAVLWWMPVAREEYWSERLRDEILSETESEKGWQVSIVPNQAAYEYHSDRQTVGSALFGAGVGTAAAMLLTVAYVAYTVKRP